MTVSGLGGDDGISGNAGLAGRTLLTLNGNAGLDTISGGDGADRISGGEAADVLDGAAGDDKVTGDRGGDQMRGGAGDDVLEWNDGDGSDVTMGGDGADLDACERVGHGRRRLRAGSQRSGHPLRTDQLRCLHDRPRHGADRAEHASAVTTPMTVKAGLAGRLGVLADGGSGNDRLEVRNQAADAVLGGSGTDSAVVDLADTTADVESVDRPARSRAKVARKVKVAVRNGRIVAGFSLSCPAGAEARLPRRALAEQRQGDPDRRHQGAAGPRQPALPGRSRREGRGERAAARASAALARPAAASSRCAPWSPRARAASLTQSARNVTLKLPRA